MKNIHITIAAVLAWLVYMTSCCSAATQETSFDVETKLAFLKPLPKVHYSFGLSKDLIDNRNSRLLYELARITHSLSITGEWCTESQVDNCVYVCARVNKTKPQIKSSLAVNFGPWHRRFGKDLPPTDKGSTYEAEIRFFIERMKLVKKWVASSNKKYSSDVKVSVLIFDSERFKVRKGDPLWNEAMRQKLDEIHNLARALFPSARIEWFGRGIRRVWADDGWGREPYFTGKEIKAPLSCSLYRVPEIECTRQIFRKTCELAEQMNISDVTPWVALASGWRRSLGAEPQVWSFNWPYDIIYSHQIGMELNISWFGEHPKRYAPYNRAKVVIFFPRPFDKRTPEWARHFIAYVRGATGVKYLKDLGYEE